MSTFTVFINGGYNAQDMQNAPLAVPVQAHTFIYNQDRNNGYRSLEFYDKEKNLVGLFPRFEYVTKNIEPEAN